MLAANVIDVNHLSPSGYWVLLSVSTVLTLAFVAYVINFRGVAYRINLRGGMRPERKFYRTGVVINRAGLCLFVALGVFLMIKGLRGVLDAN
ncbi:hypothetical protein GXW83_33195 [Streptacidiphilus sp. PB12-B1b]|uniref:hypothetical protein n=1 Tax=Streptacidiphilus sp. PB12-B1b TaxID=2705012 RepID=UPI0015F7FF8C|nr:hypothetical protein [Streptacidiphilus sp. PB12-B1b]QMU79837.1 hypothetical protein GXW83_33195 [Streptacidiphilus sp. PB12-B1b]